MIRVILADDHHLVRQGVRALLEKVNDIEVIAEAENGQQAVEMAEALSPEVVVMDISMPRMDGAQAAQQILSLPGTAPAVIILSVHADAVLTQQLLRSGVKGYLLKNSIAEELPWAIRAATRGELYLSPAISETVLHMVTTPVYSETSGDLLTAREREVLQLIAEGHTNNEIAEILTISYKTVEKHRSNLMAKLNVHDLPTLIRTAIRDGLIFLDNR